LYRVAGRGNAIRRAPFSPVPRYTAHGRHIFETDGASYLIRVRDGTSFAVVRVLGDPSKRIPITEETKRSFLRDTLQFWPTAQRVQIEAAFRRMMVHESFPLVADMLVDAAGYAWLRGQDAEGLSNVWDIYSPTGDYHIRLALPEHRRILDVGMNVVVLLQSGQYGEDIVTVYSLDRHIRR
jgi:hypothetical protein